MSRLAGQAICTRVLRGPRHIRVPHFTSSASVDADSAGGGVDEVAQQPAAAILPIVGGVSGVPIVSHYLALSNSTGGRFTRFPHLLTTPDPKQPGQYCRRWRRRDSRVRQEHQRPRPHRRRVWSRTPAMSTQRLVHFCSSAKHRSGVDPVNQAKQARRPSVSAVIWSQIWSQSRRRREFGRAPVAGTLCGRPGPPVSAGLGREAAS